MLTKTYSGAGRTCRVTFEHPNPGGAAGAALCGDVPLRSAQDPANQGRLEDIFPDGDAWENERGAVEALLPRLAGLSGWLGSSGTRLLVVQQQEDEI